MSDVVSIRITADTSGMTAGMQEIRGDLSELKGTVQSAADGMAEGFAGMRGAVEHNTQSVGALAISFKLPTISWGFSPRMLAVSASID